jgi:hypothetical protein
MKSHRVAILDEESQARYIADAYERYEQDQEAAFHAPNHSPLLERMENLPRDPEEALDQFADYDVVVADQNYTKPFYSGMDLLKEAAGGDYGTDVILYTGDHGLGEAGLDIEHASELTGHNNIEYIPKHGASSGMEELAPAINRALTGTEQGDQQNVT